MATLSSPVLAVDKCHIPPPAWWNAPKVTYTYSGDTRDVAHTHYASSRSSSPVISHTFSAQRRSESRYIPWSTRYRDPFGR